VDASKIVKKFGLAALVAWSAGCVPLTDYQALEKRFKDQETYVVKHKNKLREKERQEQVLTLRGREKERQVELLRTRLKKSETMRSRLHLRLKRKPRTVAASAPRPVSKPAPAPTPARVLGLEVNPETKGLVLDSKLVFRPGYAKITGSGKQVLSKVARMLNSPKYRGAEVRIDGHTDDTPIRRTKRSNKSNWNLSAKRALTVLHYLEQKGIGSKRLSFAGYGEHKPLIPGKSKRARAKNRRVEIVVLH